MIFAGVGYCNVEHKEDCMSGHIGFYTGRVIEITVLFKVYSNFLDISGSDCLLKAPLQYPGDYLKIILLEESADRIEIIAV